MDGVSGDGWVGEGRRVVPERVVARQAAQFGEEAVGIDVVDPYLNVSGASDKRGFGGEIDTRRGHRLREVFGRHRGEQPFDPT